MSDYSKENVEVLNSIDEYTVGEKVKLSKFYTTNYCGVSHLENQEYEIVKITVRNIPLESIEKSDRPMYASKYGQLDRYNLIGIYAKIPNSQVLYLGSQFGFVK